MNNNYETKQTVYIIFDSNDSSVSSFNSYLVVAIKRQGIDVLLDAKGPEQENGRFLGIKIVLMILSDPYIFSVACLENLVKLHEFRQEMGYMVVPVFFDLSVSVIKEQMERCEAFAVHEKSFSVDKVTKWRRALFQTMQLQGHEYIDEQREESKFIEEIVQDVFEKLYPTEDIGIPKVLPELENLLCMQPWGGRRTLAILGECGIGKTTLVKAAVRKMSSGYDADHFIRVSNENIPEFLSDEDFKETTMENFYLNNQDAEPCLRSKRVLIVLDDVKSARDAEAFLGEFDRFGRGSLLIITSRHREVLEQFHVNAIYELKGLNNEDSLKLFTRCLFGKDVIDEEGLKFSKRAIENCDGNPSAIRSRVDEIMKAVNMERAWGMIRHNSFNYNKKQHLSFAAARNDQSHLVKLPGLDIDSLTFGHMLSNILATNLDFNFVQQSPLSATSHNYLLDLKDLPRLYISSHVLDESLSSDLRIPHSGQEYVLNKPWEIYKSFQIDDLEKFLSSEARKIECTNILVIDHLEPSQILNLRGCIESKHLPEFVRAIREWKFEGKILQCRLQKDYICPHCNSANESHLSFDITFIWSILTTISNRIQSWEVVIFALLNLTGSTTKKILSRMEWQLTVYSRWFKRNIISIVRKSRLNIASGIP